MHVSLTLTTSTEYANEVGLEIDWDETGNPELLSYKEQDLLQRILTCETSIYLLRRVTGACGSNVDSMVDIRREFINEYEVLGREYEVFNEFV